jgi:hypothetical protein
MRKLFTAKEISKIEDKACEVGIRIGTQQERVRILILLEEWFNEDYPDFNKIIKLINRKTK